MIDTGKRQLLQMQNYNSNYGHPYRQIWAYPLCHLLVLAMVMRITIFMRGRYYGDFNQVDSYKLVNIIVTFAMILVLIAMLHDDVVRVIRNSGSAVKCIIFYYFFCAIVGSFSPSLDYAVFRTFEFLAFFLAIMLIIRKYNDFFHAEKIVLLWVSLILLANFAGHIRLNGWDYLHTNIYSLTAVLLFTYSFGELTSAAGKRKKILIVLSSISLVAVLMGTSTGTNIALVSGIIVLFLLSSSHRRYMLIIIPVLILVCGWNSLLGVILGNKTSEQIVNLANRANVWKFSWGLFIQHPFFGYGLNVATREYSSMNLESHILSSHNSYIEALLAGGILGAGVLFFGYFVLLRDLLASVRKRSDGSLGCCAAAVVLLINGISTPTIGYTITSPGIAFAFILALFVYHVRSSAAGTPDLLDIASAQWSGISQLQIYRNTAEPSAEHPVSF